MPVQFRSGTSGKREGSRRRLSWTEGWEEYRKARFSILQATASEAEEPSGWSPSQAQEILVESPLQNNRRSLYN